MVHESQHTMLFGKFKGMHVLEVDEGYLKWSINNVKMNERQRYIVSCYLNGAIPDPNFGRKKAKTVVSDPENEDIPVYKNLPLGLWEEAF